MDGKEAWRALPSSRKRVALRAAEAGHFREELLRWRASEDGSEEEADAERVLGDMFRALTGSEDGAAIMLRSQAWANLGGDS